MAALTKVGLSPTIYLLAWPSVLSAQLSSEALLGLIDWEVPRHKISKIILQSAGREHFE